MNSKDIRVLLSAFADDELGQAERETVEKHLEACADCRSKLEEYRVTGEIITSLKATGNLPDISKPVLVNITLKNTQAKKLSWKRSVIIAVPVLVITAVSLVLHLGGIFGNPEAILAKACETTSEIESFRSDMEIFTKSDLTDGEPVQKAHFVSEYASTTEYHLTGYAQYDRTFSQELIVKEDRIYVKGEFTVPPTEEEIKQGFVGRENTLEQLGYLIEIETLEDEYIDGVLCYHYRGELDREKMWLEWLPDYTEAYRERFKPMAEVLEEQYKDRDESERPLVQSLDEMVREALENAHEALFKDTSILEFWIGKDDLLIYQVTMASRPVNDIFDTETTTTVKYYDYNEPIEITLPFSETGELEEGWYEINRDSFQND